MKAVLTTTPRDSTSRLVYLTLSEVMRSRKGWISRKISITFFTVELSFVKILLNIQYSYLRVLFKNPNPLLYDMGLVKIPGSFLRFICKTVPQRFLFHEL